jgi:phage major head subunit gpT-like protein
MVMNRATFARDLQDGIDSHFGMSYKKWPEQWSQIYEKRTSKRAFEEQVMRVGLGEAVEHSTYALAFSITQEAIDDNLYANIAEEFGSELAQALKHAKEVRGWSLLNNAFDSNYTYGDGVSLCNSAHPLWVGGNFSNVLSTAADLSEEALEDMITAVTGFVDDRGHPRKVIADKLVIPYQLNFQADRILQTEGRVGTANNDINALKRGRYLPGGVVSSHYLTDPDAYFLQTDVPKGLTYWQRKGVQKGMEKEFTTGNLMYKVSERFSFSNTDPRSVFGSSGSSL